MKNAARIWIVQKGKRFGRSTGDILFRSSVSVGLMIREKVGNTFFPELFCKKVLNSYRRFVE